MVPNGIPGPPKSASRFSWKVLTVAPEEAVNKSEALTNPEDAWVGGSFRTCGSYLTFLNCILCIQQWLATLANHESVTH